MRFDVLQKMLRLLTVYFVLLLASCSDDPDTAVRRAADQFLQATTVAEFRKAIFVPPDIDKAKVDRMTQQVMAALSALDSKPEIQGIEVRGRWAHINLTKTSSGLENLMGVNNDGEWRVFWDPAGTLIWGKQAWHSQLSEADWADYRSLKKKIGEQGVGGQPATPPRVGD